MVKSKRKSSIEIFNEMEKREKYLKELGKIRERKKIRKGK